MTTCDLGVGIGKLTLEGSSSAQVIASNDDLLWQILDLLPTKSLLRFKSVSKRWLSLISDPHFTRRRYLKSKTILSAFYLDCYGRDSGRHYKFVPLDTWRTRATFKYLKSAAYPLGIRILQSCHGLLCCRSIGEDKYFIFNPTTNQFRTLPPIPFRAGKRVLGVSLAFDPSISHSYKVVCIQGRKSSHDGCQILIYSSESVSGGWRVCGALFTVPPSVKFQGVAYWNGAIHWLSLTDSSLYFDLNEELVREMPMPSLRDVERLPYFGESNGHLHLVDSRQYSFTSVDVYEMKRDHSGWFVKFRVDVSRFSELQNGGFPFIVLCVVRGEKEDDSFLILQLNVKVIRYNFVKTTHQEIRGTTSRGLSGWPSVFQYTENLSLV